MPYAWVTADVEEGQVCMSCGKTKKGRFYVKLHQPGWRLGVGMCSQCCVALGRAVKRNGDLVDEDQEDENVLRLPLEFEEQMA